MTDTDKSHASLDLPFYERMVEEVMGSFSFSDKLHILSSLKEMEEKDGWICTNLKPNIHGEILGYFHRPITNLDYPLLGWIDGKQVEINVVTFLVTPQD